MDLIEIDIVSLEALQAIVDLGQDCLAGQASAVWPGSHPPIELGRDNKLVPAALLGQNLPQDLLACAVRVDISGIDEVDAGVQGGDNQRSGFFQVEGPGMRAPVGNSVTHAAQA